jgi:uncharacterized membrane protein HdeD (DUF308 family)
MNTVMTAVPHHHRIFWWSIVWPVLLIVFSLIALASPFVTSIWFLMVIGCLLIFSSAAQVVHAFQSKGVGHILWKLFIALLYFVLGLYLLTNPVAGVTTVTLIVGIFFLAEGGLDLVAYITERKKDGSVWILLDGIVTLVLGVMIVKHWPSSSLWVLGTLIAVSMFMTGISRLMISLAVSRLSEAAEGRS